MQGVQFTFLFDCERNSGDQSQLFLTMMKDNTFDDITRTEIKIRYFWLQRHRQCAFNKHYRDDRVICSHSNIRTLT